MEVVSCCAAVGSETLRRMASVSGAWERETVFCVWEKESGSDVCGRVGRGGVTGSVLSVLAGCDPLIGSDFCICLLSGRAACPLNVGVGDLVTCLCAFLWNLSVCFLAKAAVSSPVSDLPYL
jgi:hypothetical protein